MPRILARQLPPPPWGWTDDTEMAASIVEMLEQGGQIDQDALCRHFADRMTVGRGYGAGAYELLESVREGRDWRVASRSLFRGTGSFGNGGAMRSAPLGAYFADDLERAIEEASLATVVTHAHPEGVAGGIAVAAAAAHACAVRAAAGSLDAELFDVVLRATPPGYTHDGIVEARTLGATASIFDAAKALGNGTGVTAPDTVPLCLWVCAHHGRSYEEALWTVVAALGDRDTTAAIVGGILACALGTDSIPPGWRAAREALPLWPSG